MEIAARPSKLIMLFANKWHESSGSRKGGQFAKKGRGNVSMPRRPGGDDNGFIRKYEVVNSILTPFGYEAEITKGTICHFESSHHFEMLSKKREKSVEKHFKITKAGLLR